MQNFTISLNFRKHTEDMVSDSGVILQKSKHRKMNKNKQVKKYIYFFYNHKIIPCDTPVKYECPVSSSCKVYSSIMECWMWKSFKQKWCVLIVQDQLKTRKALVNSQPRTKTAPAGEAPTSNHSLGSTFTGCRNSAHPPANQHQANDIGVAR